MKKQNYVVSSLLCGAIATLSPSIVSAQNYWKSETGMWSEAANWSQGVPTVTRAAEFGKYDDSFNGLQTVTVDANTAFDVYQLRVGYGQAAHIQMEGGSTLELNNTSTISAGYGTGTGPSSLTISAADAGNISTVNFKLIVISGHANGSDGNSLTLSGPGLRVNTNSEVRLGQNKSGNSLTVSNGAHFDATYSISVSRVGSNQAANTDPTAANNNRLVVDGAGSRVTIDSAATIPTALSVGSFGYGSQGVSGNRAEVTNGGFMRVTSPSATTSAVSIGTYRYSTSNAVEVSGANSRLEIGAAANGLGIQIGAKAAGGMGFNSNQRNNLTIRTGGFVKNEGRLEIYNTQVNGLQNHVLIGAGGTYAGSEDIVNQGGVIYLEKDGSLIGEVAGGTAAKNIAVNLKTNSTYNPSTLYAEGSGLGSMVNVNAETGSLISIGNAANSSVTALELNSEIVMAAGSTLQMLVFSGSNAGSINFGANGSLRGATTLAIVLAGYTPTAGDEWVIFSGNTAGVDGSFSITLGALPTLSSGLTWDISRLNADGGWVLGVVPEPRTSAMAIGAAVLALAFVAKRRLSGKSA